MWRRYEVIARIADAGPDTSVLDLDVEAGVSRGFARVAIRGLSASIWNYDPAMSYAVCEVIPADILKQLYRLNGLIELTSIRGEELTGMRL